LLCASGATEIGNARSYGSGRSTSCQRVRHAACPSERDPSNPGGPTPSTSACFHPLPTGAPRGVDDPDCSTAERLSRRCRLPRAPHPHDLVAPACGCPVAVRRLFGHQAASIAATICGLDLVPHHTCASISTTSLGKLVRSAALALVVACSSSSQPFAEKERIQRETARYSKLAQTASASIEIIFDTVRGWREAGHPVDNQ
jgi:hypothetical protein